METWRTKKGLYTITETGRGIHEQYPMMATGEEVKAWCKTKREAHGYIKGLGGDRTYDCFAVLERYY